MKPLTLLFIICFSVCHGLQQCFPNPSMRCSVKGGNLIGVYRNVQTEQFCAERCIDFPTCHWWTYHDKLSETNPMTCELFHRTCHPVPSKYSRYDARCGSSESSFVTLVIGGLNTEGQAVKQIEAFDFQGACERADFITRPLESSIIPWKHATSFISYLNTIISCGGFRNGNQSPSNSCLIYDFNQLKWYKNSSVVPDMRIPRLDFTMVYAYGEVYAMGGHNGGKSLSCMEIYNPVSRTWRSGPSMASGLSNHCALKVKECIYVIGGMSRQNGSAETFMARYNVTSQDWKLLEPMNIGRLNHACTYDPQRNLIIVSGGEGTPPLDLLSYIEIISFYDLESGQWIDYEDEVPPSKERRIKQSITLYQGKPVIIDGRGRNADLLEFINMIDPSNTHVARVQLQHERSDFSWINVPQEMIVTGCHNDR